MPPSFISVAQSLFPCLRKASCYTENAHNKHNTIPITDLSLNLSVLMYVKPPILNPEDWAPESRIPNPKTLHPKTKAQGPPF